MQAGPAEASERFVVGVDDTSRIPPPPEDDVLDLHHQHKHGANAYYVQAKPETS